MRQLETVPPFTDVDIVVPFRLLVLVIRMVRLGLGEGANELEAVLDVGVLHESDEVIVRPLETVVVEEVPRRLVQVALDDIPIHSLCTAVGLQLHKATIHDLAEVMGEVRLEITHLLLLLNRGQQFVLLGLGDRHNNVHTVESRHFGRRYLSRAKLKNRYLPFHGPAGVNFFRKAYKKQNPKGLHCREKWSSILSIPLNLISYSASL